MANPKAPRPPELRDAPHAPTIFVDEITGAFPSHNDITITFARKQSDYSGPAPQVYRQVVARIVIPRQALKSGGQFLADFLASLEKSADQQPAAAKAKMN
jgi:hypothetical protein